MKNIKFCFPLISNEELKSILRDTYTNLTDVALETLAAYGKSPKTIVPRLKFVNPELLKHHYSENRPVIVMGAHLANWEYPNIAIPSQQPFIMASMIKPITNKRIDKYINKKRASTGAQMVSIYGSQRALIRANKNPWAFVFISDQYPPNQKRAIPAMFFNRKVKFLHGAQQIANKKNYPLYGVTLTRIKRGYYEMKVDLLSDHPAQHSEEKLTQLYATYLENMICNKPSDWLWSHKRWKRELNY